MNSRVGWRYGWGWTIGAGVLLTVLAMLPSLDAVLWRAAMRVAPWLLLAGAVAAALAGLVVLVRGWWR